MVVLWVRYLKGGGVSVGPSENVDTWHARKGLKRVGTTYVTFFYQRLCASEHVSLA